MPRMCATQPSHPHDRLPDGANSLRLKGLAPLVHDELKETAEPMRFETLAPQNSSAHLFRMNHPGGHDNDTPCDRQ